MCLILAKLIIGFYSFFFASAVYSTNEANKAGLKQSVFLDVYGCDTNRNDPIYDVPPKVAKASKEDKILT
jgi:hypothetical protein